MILIVPASKFWFSYPHLGIGYIASSLEKTGEKVRILDMQCENDYASVLKKEFFFHDTVGLTVNAANVDSALEVAGFIRRYFPDKKIIMGGPLATVAYQHYIPRYADIVVLGEGERAITEIARNKDLSKVNGIAYWDGKAIGVTAARPFIDDLDSLPYPSWHLVDLKRYNCPVPRRTAIMITSRGCPYDCINCTKKIHGYRLRERSIDNVIGEIDFLVNERGVQEIHFWDDLFTHNPERVKEMCRRIIRKGYQRLRFAIPAGIRADVYDREMFVLMRRAGFYAVIVAVESGSQKVIDGLGKRLDVRKVPVIVDTLRELGFKIGAFFMLGTPHDNRETMQETLNFAKKLKIHHVFFFITIPFPGTKLYAMVEQNGRFLQDMRACGCVYDAGKAVFEMGELTAKDVEDIFKRAYREFYFRPAQLCRSVLKAMEDPGSLVHMVRQGLRILYKGRRIIG